MCSSSEAVAQNNVLKQRSGSTEQCAQAAKR
jgi:hypothetical protein